MAEYALLPMFLYTKTSMLYLCQSASIVQLLKMGIFRLAVLAIILACSIGCSNGAQNVDNDENKFKACIKECENKDCKALNNMKSREGRTKKCTDFLHEKCDGEENVQKCFSSFKGRTYKGKGCNPKVIKNAKPCLKCEAECDKSFGSASGHDHAHHHGHGDDDDANRDGHGNHDDHEDHDDHGHTNHGDHEDHGHTDHGDHNDHGHTDHGDHEDHGHTDHGDHNDHGHTDHGDHDDHEHTDHGDHDDHDDEHKECYEKCADTRECRAVDGMTKRHRENCDNFAKKFCENMDYQSCIEKMKDEDNRKCSKGIRAKSLVCHTCNESCKNRDHVTGNKSESEHHDNCTNQCGKTPPCMYASKASEEVGHACDEFVAMKCGNTTDVSACVKDLNDVEDAKCPASHRMNVTACTDCERNCIKPRDKQMNQCLMNCSQTESCMAVNAEDAPTNCDDWIAKSCGNFTNVQECLEMNLMKDDGCPEPFRRQIADCRKCEKQCMATGSR